MTYLTGHFSYTLLELLLFIRVQQDRFYTMLVIVGKRGVRTTTSEIAFLLQ